MSCTTLFQRCLIAVAAAALAANLSFASAADATSKDAPSKRGHEAARA